jgi:hypothetical protein
MEKDEGEGLNVDPDMPLPGDDGLNKGNNEPVKVAESDESPESPNENSLGEDSHNGEMGLG